MEHDIDYDPDCECYVWWYNNTGMCLAAETHEQAEREVTDYIEHGIYPENQMIDEYGDELEYDEPDVRTGYGYYE